MEAYETLHCTAYTGVLMLNILLYAYPFLNSENSNKINLELKVIYKFQSYMQIYQFIYNVKNYIDI